MNKTKIEWCDYTWNPIAGCSAISEGCANCYAAAISRRFHKPWGTPVFMPERLAQPAMQKHAGRVFVCSMSDIGHEGVTDDMRGSIYAAMRDAPWHTYIVLTKRPGPWLRHVPVGCWVGVSIETQTQIYRWNELFEWADVRSTKFVSVEPMLGPVSIYRGNIVKPDWVICGPENGAGARPCKPEWIEALSAESPCFFDKRPIVGVRREWPETKGATA